VTLPALNTSANNTTSPPTTNGWIEDAHYSNCFFVCSKLTANEGWWVVPNNPGLEETQTIYLFIALEDSSGSDIVQPVLEWGPSCATPSGSFWSIASYYVFGSTCAESVNTPAGEVMPGQTLSAYVACFNTCNSNTWDIGIGDHTNGIEETMSVTADAMYNAYIALEAYNIYSCREYSSSGVTEFYYEYVSGGTPGWQNQFPNRDCPDDNVVAQGSSTVYLDY
jgi:hypothetical protein